MAEYIIGITEELHKIGLLMLKESLENMNQLLKESGKRKSPWLIERDSQKQLITSLGTVRRYFMQMKNKKKKTVWVTRNVLYFKKLKKFFASIDAKY